jgi:RecJ-like exonuclease
MMEVRKLKKSFSHFCLFGGCKDCSRIDAQGKGIHDVEFYQVYKYTEETDCDHCDGRGTIERECPECYGSGIVHETCEDCKGSGRQVDLCGKEILVREEYQIIKEEKKEMDEIDGIG